MLQTLQDNSYRNETFAAVSGIPLADVNELEIFTYAALGFDTAVGEDAWRSWLDVVVDRSLGAGNLGLRSDVHAALRRLANVTNRPLSTPASSAISSPVFDRRRAMTPPNSAAAIAHVNLDASGPLESPLHLDGRRRLAPSPTRWTGFSRDFQAGANVFETSHLRSFGFEQRLPVGVSC